MTGNVAASDTKLAISEALEAVAVAVETRAGNPVYAQAWKIAAKIIRSYKPV